ncbi:hypothetical protein RHIZ404_220815 [Rhizobium sp. EC-SD404]|nr:hypothetical protein RHIZ404_220815 [Rhizobium sp. EC-SD404]
MRDTFPPPRGMQVTPRLAISDGIHPFAAAVTLVSNNLCTRSVAARRTETTTPDTA